MEQYMRCGQLFLQCIEETGNRIITLPATYTDYTTTVQGVQVISEARTHFTTGGLTDVDFILENAILLSTE